MSNMRRTLRISDASASGTALIIVPAKLRDIFFTRLAKNLISYLVKLVTVKVNICMSKKAACLMV